VNLRRRAAVSGALLTVMCVPGTTAQGDSQQYEAKPNSWPSHQDSWNGQVQPGVIRAVRLRADMPYVHMILLTSRESKEDIIVGLGSGADDYLTKPFNPEELRARLRTGERILRLEDSLVEAREQMRFKATHDPLTCLWNRSVILDLLQREVTRARRDEKKGGVIKFWATWITSEK
jgi:CheY-like chemotaxis protein